MVTLTTSQSNKSPEKEGVKQNVFEKPVLKGKTRMEQRKEAIRARNVKKGYTYLIFSVIVLISYSIAFLYPQTNAYLKVPGQIDDINSQIRDYDSVILPSLEAERDMHKSAYDEEVRDVEIALDRVFPKDINKFEIVRTLENFATSIHSTTPPFDFNSISFAKPVADSGYTVLPMSTSISSSTINFERFLRLINISGHLDEQVPVRLMAISNISISYRGIDPNTGEDRGVNFSVKLNAYSR